jgi:hypothetical protein
MCTAPGVNPIAVDKYINININNNNPKGIMHGKKQGTCMSIDVVILEPEMWLTKKLRRFYYIKPSQ